MIWHKAWLESRTRFLLGAIFLAVVTAWAVVNCEHAMRQFDVRPPITFARYISFLYAGPLQAAWTLAVLVLGAGGLLRERALGSAAFTLSLPVPRRRWTQIRAAVGCIESIALAMVPAIVIPMLAPTVYYPYPVWEAVKFSALLGIGGLVVFAVGLFCSAMVTGEVASVATGMIVFYFVFNSQAYLYRWVSGFRFSDILGGGEFVDRSTGFLNGWPWIGVALSLGVALMLYLWAVAANEHSDF